jgi:hypothetical protein
VGLCRWIKIKAQQRILPGLQKEYGGVCDRKIILSLSLNGFGRFNFYVLEVRDGYITGFKSLYRFDQLRALGWAWWFRRWSFNFVNKQ